MWGLVGDDYLEKCCRTPNVRSYTRECQEILQTYKCIESLSSDTSQNNPEFVIFPAEMLFGFVTVEATIWCFRTAILGSVFPPKSMFPSMAILSMKCTCMVPHLKTQADHSSPIVPCQWQPEPSHCPKIIVTFQHLHRTEWVKFIFFVSKILESFKNLLRVGDFPRNIGLDVTTIPHLGLVLQVIVTCGRKFFTKHFKELPPSFERCFMSFWCSTGMLWKWKHGVKSQRCNCNFSQQIRKKSKTEPVGSMYGLCIILPTFTNKSTNKYV